MKLQMKFEVDSATEAGPGVFLALRHEDKRYSSFRFVAWTPPDGLSIATVARVVTKSSETDFAPILDGLRRRARSFACRAVAQAGADDILKRIMSLPDARRPFSFDLSDTTEAERRDAVVLALENALSRGHLSDDTRESMALTMPRDAFRTASSFEREFRRAFLDESFLEPFKALAEALPAAADHSESDPARGVEAAVMFEGLLRQSTGATASAIMAIREQFLGYVPGPAPSPP